MPTFITIRPYASIEALEAGSALLADTLSKFGIVKRMMTYIFEVAGQGIVSASCYEAPSLEALQQLERDANLPVGMVRPVILDRRDGAGSHSTSMTTYVVDRGEVCARDDVNAVSERSAAAEAALAGELKRMEAWLYEDNDQVKMLSVYQAKNKRAIRKHAELARIPIVEIFRARIAP